MNNDRKFDHISLVIPCYNESDRIGLLYSGIKEFIAAWPAKTEVIIINDGSRDNTQELLREHQVYKEHQNVIKIYNQENTGKGGALKHGVLKAEGKIILTLDADMAARPVELLKWTERLQNGFEENVIYIGSREHRDSEIINERFKRKLAGNIFNLIVRSVTPLKVKDSQCGFKLYDSTVAHQLFGELQTMGWAHDVELLYRAHSRKIDVTEMPLKWQAMEGSKIRLLRDSINMLREILKISRLVKNNKQ